MLIMKSLSRKRPSFFQLYDYMIEGSDDKEFIISRNLYQAHERKEVLKQFERNYKLLPTRKNGNSMYHEILSLPAHKDITSKRQKEILYNIANRYLELRANGNIACGVIHEEKDHIHCHLMISSNEKFSDRRYRLEKEQYAQCQRDIENYAYEKFPELGDRRLYNKERTKNKYEASKSKDKENSLKKRTQQPSRKDRLKQLTAEAIISSYSKPQLIAKLQEHNIGFYERGNTAGIVDLEAQSQGVKKHRHRLKTLGLWQEYQNFLQFDKSMEQEKSANQRENTRDDDLSR